MNRGGGALRHRIAVERKSSTSDLMGGTVDAWITLLTSEPAKINDVKMTLSRAEIVESKRLSGVSEVDIYVRYSTRTTVITTADRITDQDGVVYDVKWVGCLDEGRHKWLLITTERGVVNP